jgi:hypothetical protein
MASSIEYVGWGAQPWGAGSWGEDLTIVLVDGVSATSTVGSVSVVAEANVAASGVEATGNFRYSSYGNWNV